MERLMTEGMLPEGLSGIMRVRNEGRYIEACIDSCINALDELVVVYTGCEDDTESILLRKVAEYPTKLKIFKYEHDVLWYGLSAEQCEYALSLPESDPRLYCNVCNYALSKVRYAYAVKIDSDQLYFEHEIKHWRNVCAGQSAVRLVDIILGFIFSLFFSLYRRMSFVLHKPCISLLPDLLVRCFNPYYQKYAEWLLRQNRAVVALSGVNVFIDKTVTVPFDGVNIHPPYNGEGDTVIFKVSKDTYYSRHTTNSAKGQGNYAVTEDFNIPIKKILYTGPVWFHLHAIREHCFPHVKRYKETHPEQFVELCDLSKMSYKDVLDKMDSNAHSLFQRTLFAYIHKSGVCRINNYYSLLNFLCSSEELTKGN